MARTTYSTLLRAPGAAAFFAAATTGRVGVAMTGLGLVWLVHAATGSYAAAGVVTGAFAAAEALAGPQVARVVDSRGQTRVLPAVLLVHAGAVAALLVLVPTGVPTWALGAAGLVAGAGVPQLGALSAARWAALLRTGPGTPAPELPAAFALESLANAMSYLVGPVLVSAVAASGHPALGTAGAAALVVTGGSALAAQRRTAPPAGSRPVGPPPGGSDDPDRVRPAPGPRWGAGLLLPGFVVLVVLNAVIGVYFGALQVSVAAFALEHRAPGVATALYAASSGSGLVAGWVYGLRRWRPAPQVQLAVATAALALACVPLLVVDTPVGLGVAVAATGALVPPVLVLCSVLAEAGVHRAVLTQAFAWMGSASAAGSAGAAAVAGRAVDASGAHAGFAVAVAAAAGTAVLGAVGARVGRRPGRRGGRAAGTGCEAQRCWSRRR